MVLVGFGCFSSFWASLVVLALVGMSGKSKIFGCHWLIFFANFWICFVIVAAAPFCFSGVPGISNTSRIISPLGKARKKTTTIWLSSRGFPNFAYTPLFLPYSLHLFPSKRIPLAIMGMSGKCLGFICFMLVLASFWATLVIS